MAKPRIELDTAEIERMAGIGMSQAEICLALGISEDTLTRRKQDSADIADAIKRGKARTRRDVGSKLMERVNAGDVTAIIWYEKTRLGYSDKLQIDETPVDWDRVPAEVRDAFIEGKVSLQDVRRILRTS